MTGPPTGRPPRRTRSLPLRVAVAVVAMAGVLAGAGGAGAAVPAPEIALRLPLATSLPSSSGTWASVPMGHLDQPLDTFWQLFLLRGGTGNWSNHAGQLGIATNGGLVLAATADGPLVVATRPSNLLEYSAMVTTATGGVWTPAPPVDGATSALAVDLAGETLALVADRRGGRVAVDRPGGGWRTLVTARSLRSAGAGRSCRPTQLTAVAIGASGTPFVGASCGRPGVAGVLARRDGTWQAAGPTLPGAQRHSQIEVLSLRSAGAALEGLFASVSHRTTSLEYGWTGSGGRWELSSDLVLGSGDRVLSIGPGPGSGEFVLLRSGAGDNLAVLDPPRRTWAALPDPPAGTSTVAFSGGRVDALAVADTVMTDWLLDPASSGWTRHQVVHVGILFGSSQ